jgi:hypothetical protein
MATRRSRMMCCGGALSDGDPHASLAGVDPRARRRLPGALAVVLAATVWWIGFAAAQDGQGLPLPPAVEDIMGKTQYDHGA